MARPQTLALDSGALIHAEKDLRIEAVIRKWMHEGGNVLIPSVALAEVIRSGSSDAAANRLIKAISHVASIDEGIARDAGARLARAKGQTLDALIVATAEKYHATDILTSDPKDIEALASPDVNIIALS